jgi:CRISPR-associated protein Cas1
MDKAGLVSLLSVDVGMPRGEMTVLAAIEQATESLARIYEDEGDSEAPLELPSLLGLRQHVFEA